MSNMWTQNAAEQCFLCWWAATHMHSLEGTMLVLYTPIQCIPLYYRIARFLETLYNFFCWGGQPEDSLPMWPEKKNVLLISLRSHSNPEFAGVSQCFILTISTQNIKGALLPPGSAIVLRLTHWLWLWSPPMSHLKLLFTVTDLFQLLTKNPP